MVRSNHILLRKGARVKRLGSHTSQGKRFEIVIVFIVRSMPIGFFGHCSRNEAVIILRLNV